MSALGSMFNYYIKKINIIFNFEIFKIIPKNKNIAQFNKLIFINQFKKKKKKIL